MASVAKKIQMGQWYNVAEAPLIVSKQTHYFRILL